MIKRGSITIRRNSRNQAKGDKLIKMLIALTKELKARENRYRAELLPNGLIHVFDYTAKTSAIFTPDGQFHSGDDTISFEATK